MILEELTCFTSDESKAKCEENSIEVLYVPKQVLFMLQPLDRSVLSVIDNSFRGNLFNDGQLSPTDVDRGELIMGYDIIRQKRLKPKFFQFFWEIVGLLCTLQKEFLKIH